MTRSSRSRSVRNGKWRILWTLIALTAFAGWAILYSTRPENGGGLEEPPDMAAAQTGGRNSSPQAAGPDTAPGPEPNRELLRQTLGDLAKATPARRADLLRGLSQTVRSSGTPDDWVAVLLAELASGRDLVTGLAFAPDRNGLASASSWRVFLLDQLGLIDPEQAAAYARRHVFTRFNSAEEWAVSLRSVLYSYPPMAVGRARAEISKLLRQMMSHQPWREALPDGLLESLDFIAHADEPAAHLASLASWSPANSHAATAIQVALERAMINQGNAVLAEVAATRWSPEPAAAALRAAAMAKADLRSEAQSKALADYLLQLPPGAEEALIFFRAFPLHRFSLAPGLAGAPRIPPTSVLRQADEAALAVFERWSQDPAFAAHHGELVTLVGKLRELTARN